MSQPHVIVVGNEKGGAGKSTIAIHLATALLHAGSKVAVIDLDLRQGTTTHFFASRRTWTGSTGVELPAPIALTDDGAGLALADPAAGLVRLEAMFAEADGAADYIVVEMARSLLGEDWMKEFVERANRGGIERVLL